MRDWRSIDKVAIFTGSDENGNRYLSEFLRDYQEIFQPQSISAGCGGCLEDYYQKMQKHLSDMSKQESNTGYVLKAKYEGIPLKFGSRIQVSNANLTDSLAEELMANHPKGKDLFEVIPVQETKDPEEKDLMDLTRKELNEMAAQLGVEDPESLQNKSVVIEAIEKAQANNKSGEEE